MNPFELIGRTLAYASTAYSLGLVSWAMAIWVLPVGTRVGLRLATVLVGQFVGCAIVVQTLGLIGLFRPIPYLLVTLGLGAAVSYTLREKRPHHSLWRLVRDTFHLWLNRTPLGLGYVGAAGLLFLAYRFFAYVRGIDSLTIHGPLVAKWIQLGRIGLTSHWNYPQCWEYQYAPNFLLLRSDVLVVIPSLLQIGVLLLLVREAASRLRIPGKIASLLSLLSVLNPVVWGGTMKNDPTFAIGLLLSLIAIERVSRGRPGAIWLAQLGTFMILGSKASGFVYAGMLMGPFVAIWLIRRWKRPRWVWSLAWLLAGTLVLQISAAAVQINNFVQRGNPTYPIQLGIGGQVIFEGPADLSGTSILEAGHDISTWMLLFRGSTFRLGLDFPFLSILLLAGTLYGVVLIMLDILRGQRPDRYLYTFCGLAALTCLLWILYTATPWTRGRPNNLTQYIRHGESLRYAIAPICLSYIVSAAFLLRLLGQQFVLRFVSSTFLVLIFAKWIGRGFWQGPTILMMWKFLGLFTLLCIAAWAVATLWRISNQIPARARGGARGLTATALTALLLVCYVQWIEKGRSWKWEQPHRNFWQYLRHRVPDGALIGSNTTEPLFGYFLLGAHLENEIRHLPLLSRQGHIQEPRQQAGTDPDYYYLAIRGSADKREFALKTMVLQGWKPLLRSADKAAILLHHPPKPTNSPPI